MWANSLKSPEVLVVLVGGGAKVTARRVGHLASKNPRLGGLERDPPLLDQGLALVFERFLGQQPLMQRLDLDDQGFDGLPRAGAGFSGQLELSKALGPRLHLGPQQLLAVLSGSQLGLRVLELEAQVGEPADLVAVGVLGLVEGERVLLAQRRQSSLGAHTEYGAAPRTSARASIRSSAEA